MIRTGRPSGTARLCALFAVLAATAVLAASPPAPAVAAPGPALDATSWLLVDRRDGEVLAAKAPNRKRAIASTTKLMTAYLAMKRLPLGRKIRMPAYKADPAESLAGLRKGERLTVEDLVHALLIASANDAAEALAVGVSGSVPEFVRQMNRAARRLELRSTSYANPIGLDQKGNRSTARDLAELAEVLLEDKRFRQIVKQREYVLRSGAERRVVTTSNDLMLADPSVDGVKTGHTADAGYVLIASAKRKGVPLLSVVLGAPSEAARDASSAALLDYGYSQYERRRPVKRGGEVVAVPVRYEDEPLPLLAARGIRFSARDDQVIDVDVDSPEQVEGPIEAAERLGRVTVRLDGRVVGSSPLQASRAISEPGLIDRIGGPAVAAAIAIALVALIVILLLAARVVRRGEGRRIGRSPEERTRSRRERARKRKGS